MDGVTPKKSDFVLHLPAQTMANDKGENVSTLPMESLFEGTQYLVFELIVLQLMEFLPENKVAMRDRHTNLE